MNQRTYGNMVMKGKICLELSASFKGIHLTPEHFAVLSLEDLDEPAAQKLINIHPQAVINLRDSFTGKYPLRAIPMLLQAGIPVVDLFEDEALVRLKPNEEVVLDGAGIYLDSVFLASGRAWSLGLFEELWQDALISWPDTYTNWVQKVYLQALEEEVFWLDKIELPILSVRLYDRPVIIVSQGLYFIEDLQDLREFIAREKPVLLAVETGADALLSLGYRPDIILGSLTEVSKKAMACGAELVSNQAAKDDDLGMKRALAVGCTPERFMTTLPDWEAGIYLAFVFGAKLIITAGERGKIYASRSLWLQNLVANRLVSAESLKNMYMPSLTIKQWIPLLLSGMFPLFALFYCFS